MGCAPSAPADPPRPVDPSAAKLVLTTPGAANQLVFDRINELRAGKEHVPLNQNRYVSRTERLGLQRHSPLRISAFRSRA